MSVIKPDAGQVIAIAVKYALFALLICIVFLLPAAWCITRGILPPKSSRFVAGFLMAVSAFLTQKMFSQPGRKSGILLVVFSSLFVFLLLLLLAAGMRETTLSCAALVPFTLCAAAGYFFSVLSEINKKYNRSKRHRRKQYK